MRIALCNEVVRDLDFAAQCELAAALGYDGLEVAPFTLGDDPHLLPASRRTEIRRAAADAGIAVTGLHWLLITPQGLHMTTPDAAVRARTIDVIERLIGLCADLGGEVLVHGSPKQRSVPDGEDPRAARDRAVEAFAAAARAAEAAGVVHCIEPLGRDETDFINTVGEAVAVIEEIGSSALRTMIDVKAAGPNEAMPIDDLIDEWLPTGMVAHIHLNDENRRGPGQGETRFGPILGALLRNGYDGIAAVEPFIYEPNGPCTAAHSIAYVRGVLEALTDPF